MTTDDPTAPSSALRSLDGARLPGWRDGPFLVVLAVGAALFGAAWWHLEGYQIADSVEYMERAIALVRGEEIIDSQAIRSFGFAGLLVPVFAVADLIGLDEYRYAVYVVRVLQIGLSLALVAMAMRLAARFVPKSSAYAAGALLVANPAFLQWSVSPISDITAGLCLALAFEQLLEPGRKRRASVGGFWLGLAFLMAYKTLAVIGPLVVAVALRERKAGRRYLGALVLGVVACLFLQCVGDWLYYGRFGLSVWIWFQENVIQQVSHRSHQIGELLGIDALKDLAQFLYNNYANVGEGLVQHDYQAQAALNPDLIVRKNPETWYLREIGQALVPPALALTAIGGVWALARPSWRSVTLVAILALNVLVLSNKGAKSFRLWLPILAWIAVLGAIGWHVVFRAGAERLRIRGRTALGVATLAVALVFATQALFALNTRKFGGFWRAIELVNAEVEKTAPEREAAARAAGLEEPAKLRFACAYHWGVFLRESKHVELVKLPHQLDGWKALTPEMRQKNLTELATLDWFVAHLPVLQDHPELMRAVNARFEVRAVLYDRFSFQGLGPFYVMSARRRPPGDPDAATFWDLETGTTVDAYRAKHGLGEPRFTFKKPRADGTWQELVLLGFEWQPIAGSGYGWLTYHWAGGPFDGCDYTIIDRVAGRHTRNVWHNDHEPAYGALPTSDWGAGWILREGYVLVPESDPYAESGPTRPLGADYRRGDAMPAWLWIKVVGYDDSEPPLEATRLVPFPVGSDRAVEELATPGAFPTFRGLEINDELMAKVGGFWIDIHPRYRWPLDGTPVPHEQEPTRGRGR